MPKYPSATLDMCPIQKDSCFIVGDVPLWRESVIENELKMMLTEHKVLRKKAVQERRRLDSSGLPVSWLRQTGGGASYGPQLGGLKHPALYFATFARQWTF